MRRHLKCYFLLLVPLAPILLGIGTFILPRFSDFSDLTISHLPSAMFIMNTIRAEGYIPFWSSQLMGGFPVSADPLAGLWYPPGWIGILIPAPYGFNLAAGLHLLWAGLGITAFLIRIGLKRPAAVFGGIAFTAMPKLLAHLAAGHISMVYSLAWFPWLLLAEELRTSSRVNLLNHLIPGCILGVITLADPRSLVYAGLLYFFYWLWKSVITRNGQRSIKTLAAGAGGFLGRTAFGLGIAAVLLLPLIQFNSLSTRADLTLDDQLVYSLPLHKLINFFIPEFGGYAEWITYSGAAVIFLFFLVVATPALRRRAAGWLILFVLAVILAFGSNLGFLARIVELPGANMLRVPARMMFLAGLSAAVVASHGVNALLDGYQRPKFDPIFWMVAAAAFFIVMIIASLIMNIPVGVNQIWGCAGLVVAVILIGLAERGKLSTRLVAAAFPVFLLADLVGVNLQSVQFRPAAQVLTEGEEIAALLREDKSIYRVYSPSYALSQLASAQAEIEMASAVHPLQLKEFATKLNDAGGLEIQGYSVTLPPLNDEDPSESNRGRIIDAGLLGSMNVKYILANYPIDNVALDEVWQNGDVWVYQNSLWQPRAVLAGSGSNAGEIVVEKNAPGRVRILADGPGILVWKEAYYPGWQARIDGEKADIIRVANLWLGVDLPAGRHQVEFNYQPGLQYLGLAISVAGWVVLFLSGWVRQRR